MKRNIAFGLRIFDTPLLVLRDVNVRPTTFTAEDNVLCHCTAELFAACAGIIDEDRNEIQGAVKHLPVALLSPRPEIIPASAVDEWRRSKDSLETIHRPLPPLVTVALVFAAAFGAQLRQIDAFQALETTCNAVVEDLAEEGQVSVDRVAFYPALAFVDRLSLFAKFFNRLVLVFLRFAVVLVNLEAEKIDKLAGMLLIKQSQVKKTLVLDHDPDEQVTNALGLPLPFFIPIAVLGIYLRDTICKFGEVSHGNGLRGGRSVAPRWIGRATHYRAHIRRKLFRWIVL